MVRLILGVLGGVACRERLPAVESRAVSSAIEPVTCGDSLRPATAAPAEGLWVFEQESMGRVAAMIGPARVGPGGARVTRRVETVETRPDGDTLRFAMDTAVVHLELLPPPTNSLRRPVASDSGSPQPAAVYAVSPRTVIASYEPCAASSAYPRLRYLRRDANGRLVIDVMLRRTSGGN